MEPFLDEEFEGVREYDRELIEILQQAGRIESDELVQRLGVKPSQTDLMKGIDQQLHQLERFGLVASTAHGWRWIG